MSYPEPRYDGDTGLTEATFRPAGHQPEVTYASGGTAHYLATGELTRGQFGLYRWEMAATPGGPGPHFHRTISESFFVLAGPSSCTTGSAGRPRPRATSSSSRRAASMPSGTTTGRRRC